MREDKHEQAWAFLREHRQLLDAYHHHKENMANAGFIIQLSLFGAVVSPSVWPPAWVQESIIAPALGTWIVYSILWGVIHIYVRWQLRNKRIAATFIAGIQESLLAWIQDPPSADDLNAYGGDVRRAKGWRELLSHFVVLPGYQVQGDLNLRTYPSFAAERIVRIAEGEGSGALRHEFLITYSSLLLFLLASVRIFLG
jgi:hypothetical protein